ncbi:hypothetical protein RA19_00205 [Leisingera sp. ANG-M1]|uniref:spike base protein, RCAP_Rcc01079 family n=1 Tax=Leisingera sp. ANG-M1 TaxID=1577895 RepID=UPI0005806411|nr:hypothetical protein [Leisingera sp. ANG-M1]KIC12864.1 hypothetical protein RA19_00205 [Leisingera sp. ANG-M1]
MSRIQNTGRRFAAVTPSDSSNLPGGAADCFWIGVAGDVELRSEDGASTVFKDVQGLLPCGSLRVLAAKTTATDIVAIYGAP